MIKMIRELFTPSNAIGPASAAYQRGAEAVWHFCLGAIVAYILPLSAFLIVLIYSIKEIIDVKNGGTIQDSFEDSASVFLGALCYAVPFWPVAVMILGVSIFAYHVASD